MVSAQTQAEGIKVCSDRLPHLEKASLGVELCALAGLVSAPKDVGLIQEYAEIVSTESDHSL